MRYPKHLAAALLCILGGTAAHARITGLSAGTYVGNTLVCQNLTDGATCRLWLNTDLTYQILYDRGRPTVPLSAKGPFRFEGRQGTYTTSIGADGMQVCLRPDTSIAWTYQIEQAGEIYAGAGCYPLPFKRLGQSWTTTDKAGHSYRMWLLKGR